MKEAFTHAREEALAQMNLGINQAELDKVAQVGLMNAQFEYVESDGFRLRGSFIAMSLTKTPVPQSNHLA